MHLISLVTPRTRRAALLRFLTQPTSPSTFQRPGLMKTRAHTPPKTEERLVFPVSTMRRGIFRAGFFSLLVMHKFACFGKPTRETQRKKIYHTMGQKKNCKSNQVCVFRDERAQEISVTRGHVLRRQTSTVLLPLSRLLAVRGAALKNLDNTFPGVGAHLNVCIHMLVCRFDERCGQNYSN